MNGLKKTLSIMLCVAMIASGSFMAFAEGESNPQNVTVVEGENGGENKEENKDEDKQQSEALLAATGALNNLPLFDSLTEDTDADALLAQVQAARKAYDALTEEEKLLVEEGKLNNLLDLEFFFENRPSNTPADAPVDQVVATQSETETADLTGEGTQANPYEIKSIDDFNSALENGTDDIYVKLVENITGAITVESGTSVVLDLNGKTFSSSDNTVTVKGTMVIKDEQAGQPSVSDDYKTVSYTAGKITSSKSRGSGVSVLEGGNLTLESGIVESTSNIGIGVHGSEKPESWDTPIESSVTVTGGLVKAQEFGVGVYGNGAELTVSGGVITTVDNAAVAGNGTCDNTTNFGGTTINIEGGTLIGNIKTAGYIANGIYHPQAGVCNISGGTIVANNGVGILMRNGELNVTGNPTIVATGTGAGQVGDKPSDVPGNALVVDYAQGYNHNNNSTDTRKVEVSGGVFQADQEAISVETGAGNKSVSNFIKGGSFSSPVDKEHLDESLKAGLYSPSANPDAPYSYYTSVEEAKAAAKDDPNAVVTDIEGNTEEALYPAAEINGKKYKTLKEAIEHVQSGDTIYVLRNVSDAQGISVPSNNNFTIDFQNHTYTLKGPGAGSSGTETQGFQLLKDSNITMKNGTIRVAENPDNIKMIIQNYANLTLENMQIYAQNKLSAGSAHAEDYVLSLNNGNVTFKGNTSIYTSSPDVIAFDVYKSTSYPSLTVTFDESYTGTINGTILYDATDAATHKLIIKGNGTLGKIEASTRAETAAKNEGITVSGGRFTAPVNKDYLAPGYNFELKSNDGTYSYHKTLADAKEAANQLLNEGFVPTAIVVDPPRKGCDVVPPSPNAPEKPNGSTGSTGSSSTVQQMEEREKPDPADKKAMEEYNFWMQVKSKIRATAEGKTLRITVKEGIEYMPASVMQTLYECKVGITLYWDGVTIEIPVGKAQPKQALRVYWTKTKLMDLYNA